jgi:hypothetical protein
LLNLLLFPAPIRKLDVLAVEIIRLLAGCQLGATAERFLETVGLAGYDDPACPEQRPEAAAELGQPLLLGVKEVDFGGALDLDGEPFVVAVSQQDDPGRDEKKCSDLGVLDAPERPDDGLRLGQLPWWMSERLPFEAGTNDLQILAGGLAFLCVVLDSLQLVARDPETFDAFANGLVPAEGFP